MGFFDKIKVGLEKTRKAMASTIGSVFSGFSEIDDDFYDELEESLILADLGVDFARHVVPNGPHGLSCANDTVYSSHGVPVCSADIPGWPETMIQFFRDMGLKPGDKM